MKEILEEDQQAWQRADELMLMEDIVNRLRKLDCGLGGHKDIIFLAEQLGVSDLLDV